MKLWAVLALCCFIGSGAKASVPAPPPEVQRALPDVKLQGEARMTFLGLRVYDARLWLPPQADVRQYDEAPLALALHYLRRLEGPAIAERSITEMRRVGSFTDAQASAWLEAMKRAFPNVADGDRLVGIHLPGRGARFYFNGQRTAEIEDAEFARLFFGIWLSPRTSEPRLRERLIGAAAGER